MAKSGNLDGNWVTLVPARTPDDTEPGLEDLDAIVREYASRDDRNKAPVVLGDISQGNRKPVARIDEVRRKGDSLEGKFGEVDPRVEFLHSRGAFPRKSVRLKRSPGSVSLDSVGLIHRKPESGGWGNGETPSLDKLMEAHSGTREAIFEETTNRRDFSGAHMSADFDVPEIRAQIAENAISDLKKRGLWCDRFDRLGLPLLFAECVKSRTIPLLSKYVEVMIDHDPADALLSERARYFAREKGINFAEAVDAVRCAQKRTGDPLTDLAYARSNERNISFSEAVHQVAEERPELTVIGRGRRSAV